MAGAWCGGVLFVPGSAERLAAAARGLFEDGGAGERTDADASRRFPAGRVVEEIEGVLREIALAARCPAAGPTSTR